MKKLMEDLNKVDEAVTDLQMTRDAALNELVELIVDEAKQISTTRPECTVASFNGMVSYVTKQTLVNLKSRVEKARDRAVEEGSFGEDYMVGGSIEGKIYR